MLYHCLDCLEPLDDLKLLIFLVFVVFFNNFAENSLKVFQIAINTT